MGKRANGEGTLYYQEAHNRWVGQYTVNSKRRTLYAKTQGEARKKLTQALHEIDNGTYTDNALTVGQWLKTWLAEYVKVHRKPKTYQWYESIVREHLLPAWQKKKLRDLEFHDVQTLLNEKIKSGLATNTVLGIKRTLQAALSRALKNRLVAYNAAHGAEVAKNVKVKERRILTLEEQSALLRASRNEDRGLMIEFALFTGLRAGEFLGLRWCDIDMDAKTFTVKQTVQRLKQEDGASRLMFGTPKTQKGARTVPLLEGLADKLLKHKMKQAETRELAGSAWEDNDLVFSSNIGTAIDPRNFQRFLSKVVDKAGIPHVNTHALRRSFSTRARENGMELEVLSNILGHSDVRLTLNTYTGVSTERTKKEMQKLDALLKKGGRKGLCLLRR